MKDDDEHTLIDASFFLRRFFVFTILLLQTSLYLSASSHSVDVKVRQTPVNLGVLSTMYYSFANISYFSLKFLQFTLNILYFRKMF